MKSRLFAEIKAVYGWRAADRFVGLFLAAKKRPLHYLYRLWTIPHLADLSARQSGLAGRLLTGMVKLGMGIQFIVGLASFYHGLTANDAAMAYFGLALMAAYPLVWSHLLPLLAVPLMILALVKPLGKRILCLLLERQVVQLRRRHQFAVVAVAGSVGKTSTKVAIAEALGTARRVRYQLGNYNVRLTVPLIFFGHDEPAIYNIFAWLKILWQNRRIIQREYPYDVVVVELAPGGPGYLAKFAYLHPELGVLTAVAPEHMEVFGTIEAVAKEETTLLDFCQRGLVNIDDVAERFLEGKEYVSYGSTKSAKYILQSARSAKTLGTQRITFDLAGHKVSESIQLTGQHGAKIALAAAAAANELALSQEDIKRALKRLHPFAGRMQILPGIKNTTIIDDTYNASPVAVKAALDVLYDEDVPQRIALLGSMNEMGDFSEQAHTEVGEYCDPGKLDLVVTLGDDANRYLAEAARNRGCTVTECATPYEAGRVIEEALQKGALILAKGSQNGVFAEEAVKHLLKNQDDAAKLVRQSPYWLKIKRQQFSD